MQRYIQQLFVRGMRVHVDSAVYMLLNLHFQFAKHNAISCKGRGKGKGKIHPRTGHELPDGEQRYSSTLSLTLALGEGGWSPSRPDRFTPGKDPVPWVGPRGRSGRTVPCLVSRLLLQGSHGYEFRGTLTLRLPYTTIRKVANLINTL